MNNRSMRLDHFSRLTKSVFNALIVSAGLSLVSTPMLASEGGIDIPAQEWTFAGPFGHFDRAQLQRGFQVYLEVCSTCHSMNLLSYRNLHEHGGPEFPVDAVKAIAAEATIQDGPNDEGEMFERPGKPSDPFAAPFQNDKEASAANNGAMPTDLSIIAKARGFAYERRWFAAPFGWLKDIALGYQEAGPDYIYALLTGYKDHPADMKMAEGMSYNAAFPGHQIAMPSPLSEDQIDYSDGTPQTVDQYARDVSAFLMWTAEPKLEQRKELGLNVMFYLLILSVLLYFVKRNVWKKIKH